MYVSCVALCVALHCVVLCYVVLCCVVVVMLCCFRYVALRCFRCVVCCLALCRGGVVLHCVVLCCCLVLLSCVAFGLGPSMSLAFNDFYGLAQVENSFANAQPIQRDSDTYMQVKKKEKEQDSGRVVPSSTENGRVVPSSTENGRPSRTHHAVTSGPVRSFVCVFEPSWIDPLMSM